MAPIGLAWPARPVWVKLATATASGSMLCFFVIRKGQRNSFQGPNERHERRRENGRPHQRHRDRPQNAKLARAVDSGGIEHLAWDLKERTGGRSVPQRS